MPMQSVMNHSFSEVPGAEIPRSSFNRSHGHKTTFDAGRLIPIYVDEALPGDTFSMNASAFARLATPIHPIMDNMFIETFFFAVPYRLLWDNWQKFNGEQTDPGDSTDFIIPKITTPGGGYFEGTLYDYMGIPTKENIEDINALHLRAYNLIWNEWFRDQNLQDSLTVPKTDGPDVSTLYQVQDRGKRHDYFTACLPFPQKGTEVNIPLGTRAEVTTGVGAGAEVTARSTVDSLYHKLDANLATVDLSATTLGNFDNILYADLTTATAATINQLREAFQVQKILERDARSGTRYTEILKAHFGVTSPDARLQRPEYLGGGKDIIQIQSVEQTSSTDATSPQGNLAAFGVTDFRGHGFNKTFDEHCILVGLVNVRADLTYQQGIDRMWSRDTRFDYYWPSLAHIGEQAVLSKEIFATGAVADQDVFGYQERFAEYRYKQSKISGLFRSNATASLDVWHLSQDFAARPTLNEFFIVDAPPIDRVIAVPTEPHFIADFHFNLKCARPLPTFSVPGLIDHF